MKKWILTLTTLLTMTATANAMSYEQAKEQALFLADKMAYELNLTEDQYEAAYEINLDYLMSVNSQDDLYGTYWRQRNLDLSYVLLSWQYNAFCAASYFYRPLYWADGFWRFGIYARYPTRTFFYYGRPSFYTVYVGGHSWRYNGGRSWYKGRRWGRPVPGAPDRNVHFGMRDGYKRGDYNRGFDHARNNRGQASFGTRDNNRGTASFGGRRTNTQNNNTTNRPATQPGRQNGGFSIGGNTANTNRGNNNRGNTSFGGQRQTTGTTTSGRGTVTPRQSSTRTTVNNTGGNRSTTTGSFGGARRSGTTGTPARSFSPTRQSSGSSVGTRQTTTRQSSPARSTSRSTRSGGGSFGGRR